MDLTSLQKAFKTAKKAYKADKSDKALKKAFKAAKKAFEEAKAAAEKAAAEAKEESGSDSSDEEEEKAPVVDIAALKKAVKEAKKVFKADKSNKEAKKALKAAKAALKAAEEGATSMEEEAPASKGTKRAREEETTADSKDAGEDEWAKLSSKKQKTETAAAPLEGEPNVKCFVGNLSFDIDDDAARDFFKDCGALTDIFWLTDRDSGKFKGCGFLTFESVEAATKACQKNGEDLMGRPLKINFAKPRPGGDRKPRKSFGARPLSEKPAGCTTVFVGNLSFNIDDAAMTEFTKECGEVSSIRWLSDRETGNFKGCGFIDFASTEGVDNFVKKNGSDLMGRAIRIDYAKSRSRD